MNRTKAARSGSRAAKNAWMTVFADLSALLLTFFVMLFSMTEFEDPEFIAKGTADALINVPKNIVPDFEDEQFTTIDQPFANKNYAITMLRQRLDQASPGLIREVAKTSRGIELEFSASLRQAADLREILDQIIQVPELRARPILIEFQPYNQPWAQKIEAISQLTAETGYQNGPLSYTLAAGFNSESSDKLIIY